MNCYFCQTKLKDDKRTDQYADRYHPNSGSWDCPDCAGQYDLHSVSVVTSLDDGELLYVHLYVPDKNFKVTYIPGPGMLPGRSFSVQCGHMYHVRLHLRENYTYIGEAYDDPQELLRVPGFPITPQNAKEKLKLYLTFS